MVLQQSSMIGKGRFVSSLDLKYLDAKFTAIPRSEATNNLLELRKSKHTHLPSIFKTNLDEDTAFSSSLLSPQNSIKNDESIFSIRHSSIDQSAFHSAKSKVLSAAAPEELAEIEKYKKVIAKVKKQNELIHREITNLYCQERQQIKQPRKKPIRKIIQLGKSNSGLILPIHPHTSPNTNRFQHIYQQLSHKDNPYKAERAELQKKFIGSNFHRSFENFLLSQNKRIPDFIKNVR